MRLPVPRIRSPVARQCRPLVARTIDARRMSTAVQGFDARSSRPIAHPSAAPTPTVRCPRAVTRHRAAQTALAARSADSLAQKVSRPARTGCSATQNSPAHLRPANTPLESFSKDPEEHWDTVPDLRRSIAKCSIQRPTAAWLPSSSWIVAAVDELVAPDCHEQPLTPMDAQHDRESEKRRLPAFR